MKLFVTSSDRPLLLYVDPRMFERDLINGVIDMELPSGIDIFTTFPAAPVLERVHAFVMESAQTSPNQGDLLVPNRMVDNINFLFGLIHLLQSTRWVHRYVVQLAVTSDFLAAKAALGVGLYFLLRFNSWPCEGRRAWTCKNGHVS